MKATMKPTGPLGHRAGENRQAVWLEVAVAATLALALTIVARADAADYLPLAVGNHWVYAKTGGDRALTETVEIRVVARSVVRGHDIFTTENYLFGFVPATVQLFDAASGETGELGPKGEMEILYPWATLSSGNEVAVSLPAFLSDCVHGSKGAMVMVEHFTVPAGAFADVALITYDNTPCSDAAVVSEAMAPGVGLIRREVLTFAGVETWELIHAHIAGQVIGRLSVPRSRSDGEAAGALRSPAPEPAQSSWGAIKAVFAP